MAGSSPSFFEGLSPEEVAQALDRLKPRRFESGTTVIAEGDTLHELYIVQSGTADILVTDRSGSEHLVNRVGPGAPLGEMSLFTGQPASAWVRAATVLIEPEFGKTGGLGLRDFPQGRRYIERGEAAAEAALPRIAAAFPRLGP